MFTILIYHYQLWQLLIKEYNHLHVPSVPDCPKLYQTVPGYTRLYQIVPGCTRLYQAVSESNAAITLSRRWTIIATLSPYHVHDDVRLTAITGSVYPSSGWITRLLHLETRRASWERNNVTGVCLYNERQLTRVHVCCHLARDTPLCDLSLAGCAVVTREWH